jgi:predicted Fe-Mo cluster-binding NifX family protein
MKICVPTNDIGGLEDQVNGHFGRAQTFTVVDTDTGEVGVIHNGGEHICGLGNAPQKVAQMRAQVVLCSGLGPKALTLLRSQRIEVYVGAKGTVKEAIDLWKAGKLRLATMDEACKDHKH